ncbi:MAG TPA: prenyltransferase/squalene oxidase repeat-containing protein [Candidatus Limnocylindrales bacterium]|nr:prenyltransferase/squalene oxidase repeat-containing protein [Candidatus Limnocylindrales bacterium]
MQDRDRTGGALQAAELPLQHEVSELLAALQQSAMSPSAYDTAYLARLRRPEHPEQLAFPQTLGWLLRHQNPDGSFGTRLNVPKERLLSTLGAVLALADLPANLQTGAAHRARAQALAYLHEGTANWQTGPDTAGFEVLLPALLDEARARELPLPYDRFAGIVAQRDAKIGHVPPRLVYNVQTPLLHSLEYLGGRLDVEGIRPRLSSNGSFANSPSATAFFLTRGHDERAWEYLTAVARRRPDGGIPVVDPFEVFEAAWVLYNLARADHRPREAQRHLLGLAQALTDDGVGVSKDGLRPDADDTALTLTVLHRYGYPISMGPLRPFEGVNSFITFPLERDASVTANAHVLEVLGACPSFPRQHLVRQKLIRFLRDARVDGDHWADKWHGSPFYATAHAVFALLASAPDLCPPALRWLASTQREDGSWGWFADGTPEETAYAVQAWLSAPSAMTAGLQVDLEKAERFLTQTQGEPVTPMWIGKTLYGPIEVVRSAVLSARILLRRRTAC